MKEETIEKYAFELQNELFAFASSKKIKNIPFNHVLNMQLDIIRKHIKRIVKKTPTSR